MHRSVHEEIIAAMDKIQNSSDSLCARGKGSTGLLMLACQLCDVLCSPSLGAVISNPAAASGCSAAITEV